MKEMSKDKELEDASQIIPKLKNEINKLKDEIQMKDSKIESHSKELDILSNLYNIGIINEEGELIQKHDKKRYVLVL